MSKTTITLLLISLTHLSFAQFEDSVYFTVESQAGIASSAYQPFWHVANHWGSIPDDTQTYLLLSSRLEHQLQWGEEWKVAYGGLVNYEALHKSWQWAEAYAKVSYKTVALSAGRYRQYWGETDSLLSSGSLGISSNALPMPAVEIALNDYITVPFTFNLLHLKGRWQHAWMGNNRFIKGAYLHAKNLYLYIGKENIGFEGGINHFAQWGGQHPNGDLPDRLQDYKRIVLGQAQKRDDTFTDAPQNYYNALGNHLFVTDLSFHWKLKNSTYKLYTQTPYETGRNDTGQGRDHIDGLYIFGKDRLVGMSVKQASSQWLNRFLIEYVYTRHQGGEGMFVGQFNYYNHTIYRSGWSNQGSAMGTPLFLTQRQAAHYFSADAPLGGNYFVSNRVEALHMGISGKITARWRYRNLLTYIKHYGNYYNIEAFEHVRRQLYAMTEWSYAASAHLRFYASSAIDFGSLSDNIGLNLGLKWNCTSMLE